MVPAQVYFPRFSNKTYEKIEKSEIDSGMRINITESIGHQMWLHEISPSSFEYTGAYQMLVKKLPVLEDPIGNGYVSYYVLFTFIYLQ